MKPPNDAGAVADAVSAAVEAAGPPVAGTDVAAEAAAVENEKEPTNRREEDKDKYQLKTKEK